MAMKKSRYINKFAEEGKENIAIAETLLFEMRESNSPKEDVTTILRALHTLKGSARMLDFRNIESLSHSLESVFTAIQEEKVTLGDKEVRLILAALDELKTGINVIKSGAEDAGDSSLLQKDLAALAANRDFSVPAADSAGDSITPPFPVPQETDQPQDDTVPVVPEPAVRHVNLSDSDPDVKKINRAKYIAQFAEEGHENIQKVESLLFDIKEGVSVQDDIITLMRALHTLKGSARMLDLKDIESLSHLMETVFTSLKEERITLNDKAVRLILTALDELTAGINSVKAGEQSGIRTAVFEKELSALSANEEFNLPAKADAVKTDRDAKDQIRDKHKQGWADAKHPGPEEAKSESIRISIDRINDIIHNMAALQSLEIVARNIARDTEAIKTAARQYSKYVSAGQFYNSPLLQEFRALELMTSKLGSLAKNYSIDAGNHIRSAYNSVISLRMLPLSTALDAYPRFVFNIASELGKRVKIKIEGAENEIDKNLIESLSEVFLHMIRNSIDHGIEPPEVRRAAGKSETGLITVRCVRESGNMKVTITDDGKGIDLEKIRNKIIDNGLVSKETGESFGDEELINYIFQSGFSTAEKISNVSGRGVGMDAVKSNIEHMKGSIAIQTRVGEGTTFTIAVPLSMASLMGFPVACGKMKFIIPANFVDTVLLINTKDIITIVDRPGIIYNGRIIKLFYLHHILKINLEAKKEDSNSVFVVIVQAYEETIALAVNQTSSMRQVILKNPPSFLESMELLSGLVLSEDYEMIPALHIPTVIRMARRTKTIDMKKRHVDYERMRKSILIVDDSLPAREVQKDILEAEGYKVDTAADGSEALSAAKRTQYDLICTDIAMPNMDGFMLTENIRKNELLKKIPVIVVSSKSDMEDKNRAARIGANRYIIKNAFNDQNLITAVRELIGEAQTAAPGGIHG
ncbi:MAG: hybrid sensor histidine kinase/response regulator [Treponema sp.]|nr:hybrid sensor histidine kinase/response regulator [Treponema sp.]